MKIRELKVKVLIEASKTHCCACVFQHAEADSCVIFGAIESTPPVKGIDEAWEYGHKRHKDCAVAEWKAKKEAKKP